VAKLVKERILAKIDELDSYLNEIKGIAPGSFEAFKKEVLQFLKK